MAKTSSDPAMDKARAYYEESGLTLTELGEKMGYGHEIARKSAWQFLRRTSDPRVSMLRRYAKALGIGIRDLF